MPDPTASARPGQLRPSSLRARAAPYLVIAALLATTAAALHLEGRIFHCACGQIRPWITNVWSSHCSQHLSDPYSITHLSHGLIFFFALAWLAPRLALAWRLAAAVGIAAAWEVVENSPPIIERYRAATMSLEYLGDSLVNAVGDVLSCIAGFLVAWRIGLFFSIALFATTELVLLALIRDNLTLNVVMLLYPLDVVRDWQTAGQPVPPV